MSQIILSTIRSGEDSLFSPLHPLLRYPLKLLCILFVLFNVNHSLLSLQLSFFPLYAHYKMRFSHHFLQEFSHLHFSSSSFFCHHCAKHCFSYATLIYSRYFYYTFKLFPDSFKQLLHAQFSYAPSIYSPVLFRFFFI